MAGSYGNDNLMFIAKCQFVTFNGTSDASAALDSDTMAVTLFASSACWAAIDTAPVAAIPSGEKVKGVSIYVPQNQFIDVAVPYGRENAPLKVGVVDDGTGGNLFIYERKQK